MHTVYCRQLKMLFINTCKQYIKLHVLNFVEILKSSSKRTVHKTASKVLKIALVLFIISSLVWLSVFMYFSVYQNYVPTIKYVYPVYFTFSEEVESNKGQHSYLQSHIQLTRRQQLLMLGQGYEIILHMDVPESPVNKQLGMFMVCAEFRSKVGELISHPCRSALLHYKSFITEALGAIFYSPLYLLGSAKEKQELKVELCSYYEEYEAPGVTDIVIEIRSRNIEIYSAKLHINANLMGVKYIMFNWPIYSAIIGILFNIVTIVVICFLTWYQLLIHERNRDEMEITESSPSSSSMQDCSESKT